MLVDSHCHLNLLKFSENLPNLDKVISECAHNNIDHFLCVAIDLANFDDILAIAKQHSNISISAGVHPNEGDYEQKSLYDQLIAQAKHEEVVAIGETGLDFYRDNEDSTAQIEKFITHIDIAKQLKKPLIIHTREAKKDTIKVLKQHADGYINGVMHCFTEDYSMAKEALDMGFYISLSGIVTFKNAHIVHDVAKKVPLDRLLVETDCPYLAPMPYRGKDNYPHYVQYVAKHIAELRNISFDELASQTTENFFRLFSHAKPKTAS